MLASIRSHLSFANVTSLVALFVALGGTSYAVVSLPKSSVGAKQLKRNAVSTKKVKDRSLLAKDFRRNQLPAGPQGRPGSDAQFTGAAAGGNLAGVYPNPTLAAGAVDSGAIFDRGVQALDLAAGAVSGGTGGPVADDTLTAADIATGAVGSGEVTNHSLHFSDISPSNIILVSDDPANVPANSCLLEKTPSYAGKTQDDFAFLFPAPNLSTGLLISNQIDINDTNVAAYRICNVTNADINPGSINFRILTIAL
jgi:hypothetical protein